MQTEVAGATMMARTGKVTEVVGTLMRVSGLDAKVGDVKTVSLRRPVHHGRRVRVLAVRLRSAARESACSPTTRTSAASSNAAASR
jgi:flagellar biosynthesis/type III secretory pathway ATPase